MSSLLDRLKQRKLVQWTLAYVAGAWAVLQVLDVVAEPWGLSPFLLRSVQVTLVAGLFVTLVLAWYHGEQGRQRMGGMELVVLTGLLVGTGVVLRSVPRGLPTASGASEAVPRESRVSLAAQLLENPAVAVLPLANMGSEDDQSFVDGLHEEILSNLAKIGALTVLSRQAVLQYRDSEKTIREIGEELNADAVLEGSVRRAGNRLRITAQLIHAESDAHLWAETYDDELTVEHVFAIQERVAKEVARALEAALTPEEQGRVSARGTENLEAYGDYLAAQDMDDRPARIRLYRRALDLDPNFAEAWAALAAEYSSLGFSGGSTQEMNDSAIYAADRAIALDPSAHRAHRVRGVIHATEGRLNDALNETRIALELSPNSFAAAWNMGLFSESQGRLPDAIGWYQRSLRLDPSAAGLTTGQSAVYMELGLDERARAVLPLVFTQFPNRVPALWTHALLDALSGDYAGALEAAERLAHSGASPNFYIMAAYLASLARDWEGALANVRTAQTLALEGRLIPNARHQLKSLLAYTLLMGGDSVSSRKLFAESEGMLKDAVAAGSENPRYFAELAIIASVSGDVARGVTWMQRAYDHGYRRARWIDLDPMFDSLRGHPEFERIMAQMRADVDRMREEVLAMEADLEAARIANSR